MASVSVAMATHNGAEYIAEQVRSILNQSAPPLEIVISDDASTDATVEIAEDAWGHRPSVARETRLRILRNDVALGVTRNFEQAIANTTGDLIALSDQDDVWRADRLHRLVDMFEARPKLTLLHSDARLVDPLGAELGVTLFEALEITTGERQLERSDGFAALLRRNLVTGATVVFRRSLLDAALPFPIHWVHDEWLAVVAAATGQIDFDDAPLVDYRQHGANAIGVQKLTLRGKFGRLVEPRGDRYEGLLERSTELLQRLRQLGPNVDSSAVMSVEQKIAHLRIRHNLSRWRLGRVVPVIREASSGAYSRFGRGAADALRDLLQPQEARLHRENR